VRGAQKTVEVHLDGSVPGESCLMGELHGQSGSGSEIFSFEYDPAWLKREDTFEFDPDLQLVTGPQYPAQTRKNFGIFLDSAPDRWGRVLMQRRENLRAREEAQRPRRLSEWDYLLGVHDETRLGALRFRSPETGVFLDNDDQLAAPPLTSLRELQAASLGFERHIDEEAHPEYARWLRRLVAPGSSLGGARPKASVRDEAGKLCIAKFPSKADTRDIGAWELLASRLAGKCGIAVPSARVLSLGESPYSTFLVRRFDRTDQGSRLAFVSAMTLTRKRDGEEGGSYLDLVELLQRQGAHTLADTHQLYRRIAFNVLIHNTDDHLRNHGFFVSRDGIRLSPAYDLNPSIDRGELTLTINETESLCDIEVVRSAHGFYELSLTAADTIIAEVQDAVATWETEATALGLSRAEQAGIADAFQTGMST
jgi:serine/threonine-protein kinase HipA